MILLQPDSQIQVARLAPSSSRLSQTCKTNALALADSFRNFDRIGLDFARCSAAKRNLACGSMQGLFKSHKDIGLDILPVHRSFLEIVAPESPAAPTPVPKNP